MNNSEQIKDIFEKLEALKRNIDELKREIEELKYFNGVLSYKLREIPDFQSENKKTPIINGHFKHYSKTPN